MEHVNALDAALDLIRQAEDVCAQVDPGMRDAAGMVYVGDVYSLVARSAPAVQYPPAVAPGDAVWPFIR